MHNTSFFFARAKEKKTVQTFDEKCAFQKKSVGFILKDPPSSVGFWKK